MMKSATWISRHHKIISSIKSKPDYLHLISLNVLTYSFLLAFHDYMQLYELEGRNCLVVKTVLLLNLKAVYQVQVFINFWSGNTRFLISYYATKQ
jgi:hypothetical protein